jgi:tetratricopeptide (TPR) repeat protein
MFGLFSKKIHQPTVTPEDKEWVEKNITWFIEVFGLDRLKEQPFIAPTTDNFPYNNLQDTEQFQKLFEQLCSYWEVNPDEIIVKFFDDFKSKQWTEWVRPQSEFKEPAGLYNQNYTTDAKRFTIQLAKSNLGHPQLLVAVVAHELAHVKLLGGNYINRNDADLEPLTDLASIFFGFGIFVANSVQTTDIYWVSRSGYLPNQLISYANALICYITKYDVKRYLSLLNTNTIDLFKKDFEFLTKTHDTELTEDKVLAYELAFKVGKQVSEGFEKRNFDDVIEACTKILENDPKNTSALNNIGYSLLQQRKYKEAIEHFTKAIDIDPHWDYPYNNRGYCKLQLDDLENAFLDLHHSFEMNPDNAYSWRNMGAYYLQTKEFEQAVRHFEEAEKIDPKTEMINFYLAEAHRKLGNEELAKNYFAKSNAQREHNDSTII